MSYSHLTAQEREVISQMRYAKKGPTEIAKALGRDKSTVSRELRRHGGPRGYGALEAQQRAERRRRQRPLERASLTCSD